MKKTILAIGFFLVTSCVYAQQDSGTFKYIELKSSNWEAYGRSIRIEADGSCQTYSVYPGEKKDVKKGQIDPAVVAEVARMVREADLSGLDDAYLISSGITRSNLHYQVTVSTGAGVKTVVFDSDNPAVPAKLKDLAAKIEVLAS